MNNDLEKNNDIANDDKIRELEQTQQHIDTPEALERLERSLRKATENLSALKKNRGQTTFLFATLHCH
jgi:hypothetical protein